MQELIYDLSIKQVTVYHSDLDRKFPRSSKHPDPIYQFDNVLTVGMIDGCYEVVIQEDSFTVLKVPISKTNMIIKN